MSEVASDIGYCATCARFVTCRRLQWCHACLTCGRETSIVVMDPRHPAVSLPIPIPPAGAHHRLSAAVPARLESPRLTPNLVSPSAHWPLAAAAGEGEDAAYDLAVQESMLDAPSPGVSPADPRLLESMARFQFVPLGDTPTPPCPVCLEDIAPGEDVVETRCCRHVAHHGCMESTLCVIASCPFCRQTTAAPASL